MHKKRRLREEPSSYPRINQARQEPGTYFVGVPVQAQVSVPDVDEVGVRVTVTAAPTEEGADVPRTVITPDAFTDAEATLPTAAMEQSLDRPLG